jgi:oligoendopeptidase F
MKAFTLLQTGKPGDRTFLPIDFVSKPDSVEECYCLLYERDIQGTAALEQWLKDWSELESVLDEDMAWRYIRMTCDTTNEALQQAYHEFVETIFPLQAPWQNKLNHKLLTHPDTELLDQNKYFTLLRSVRTEVELFREENVALETQLKKLESKYGQIAGSMSIQYEGNELTMQQAAQLLKDPSREKREKVYHLIQGRRKQDENVLDELLSEMIALRHQMALNAGFENYRDYKFAALGRYDYTAADCFDFHSAVERAVMPLVNQLNAKKKAKLGLSDLMPWDLRIEEDGLPPLKPFTTAEELLENTIEGFQAIHPYFGDCLYTMKQLGHFDLSSRKGKAPGGYNYPLMETGAPFIFMNATSDFHDLETMVHEGGHAIHSFLTKDLAMRHWKSTPMEIAEVASMAMELISMEQWHLFFPQEEDLKRAKRKQIQQTISLLGWIAAVDQFQHWLYEHPQHSIAERREAWKAVFSRFTSSEIGWDKLPEYVHLQWQAQLHIFEVPFYYIEYGIAQLGALAVWKNVVEDREKGLQGYIDALSLGYKKPLTAIYDAAGIKFDFSETYIRALIQFVDEQLQYC